MLGYNIENLFADKAESFECSAVIGLNWSLAFGCCPSDGETTAHSRRRNPLNRVHTKCFPCESAICQSLPADDPRR